MKHIFFAVFLVFIITSCEDDINSPNIDPPTLLGCTEPIACNYDINANTDDGSCIWDDSEGGECDQYDACDEGDWVHHTCVDSEDDSSVPNWNGSETNCLLVHTFGEVDTCQDVNGDDYGSWDQTEQGCLNGHVFTPGSCNTNSSSDDGGDDGSSDDGGTDG